MLRMFTHTLGTQDSVGITECFFGCSFTKKLHGACVLAIRIIKLCGNLHPVYIRNEILYIIYFSFCFCLVIILV